MYAASAFAANTMIRSIAGFAFPLFINQMFSAVRAPPLPWHPTTTRVCPYVRRLTPDTRLPVPEKRNEVGRESERDEPDIDVAHPMPSERVRGTSVRCETANVRAHTVVVGCQGRGGARTAETSD